MNQMMVATKSERIFRIRWDGVEERDFSLDLKRIPFSINQQVSYGTAQFEIHLFWYDSTQWHTFIFIHVKYLILFTHTAVPILESNTYVSSMEYSPLIGGFAITLNDGRAAYLTANSLKFDPNVSWIFVLFSCIQYIILTLNCIAASARYLGPRFGWYNMQ